MKYEIKKNNEFKSIEISFDEIPSAEVRNALKALRFRWHSVKRVWYGYTDEETARKAIEGEKVSKAEKAPKKAKENKYGVKVGDVFYMSWGYEQTNVDFFQVAELVGECSVRVRHVNPVVVKDESYSHGMASDYTYNITPEQMPVDTCNVFIKDSEKGDLKKVQVTSGVPYIRISNHIATRIPFGLRKEYVSWYA